ncbi:MAG: membrane fusion protein MtrC [Verrucomicrobiales bacterium]|nr:membrane fusion protein MtrC [Verrucomicrobiales bacterium]
MNTTTTTTSLLVLLLGTVGQQGDAAGAPDSGSPAPAQVTAPVKETTLATVTLSAGAEARLGIRTVAAEQRNVAGTRLFGGVVVRPLGGDGGAAGLAPLWAGSFEELLKLADTQVEADGRVAQAEVEQKAAELALDRARKVLAAEAGSVRAVDEAAARSEAAGVALTTARAHRDLLGEPVQGAAPSNRLWVRVPVYAGALPSLDAEAAAQVMRLSDRDEAHAWAANPVAGPLTANGSASTVDWYFQLPAGVTGVRPGERLAVRLATRTQADRLVVPWPAVLHDIHGGQWVYEQTEARTFVRRRVEVERVAGTDAILARGLRPSAKVVTDGAAELFGTEFGAGK